jgi:RNA polymerase-interacting CarD/CdnL/TRCF family regulator
VVVRTVERDLRILVPLESAPAGLRRVINAEEAGAVLAELEAEAQPTPVWTTQSFADLQRKAFGRSPLVVAGIVRDLTAKATGARLRSNEQILLARATDLVAAELGVALRLTRNETAVRMAAALEVGRSFTEQRANPAPGATAASSPEESP